MNHFVLIFGLVELRVYHFGIKKPPKENRNLRLFQLFVVAELCLPIISPD